MKDINELRAASIESRLGYSVNRCALLLKAHMAKTSKHSGLSILSSEQMLILSKAVETPAISMKELSRESGRDKGNTTKIVDKLISLGFLEKRQSTKDRRSFLVSPTKLGLQKINTYIPFAEKESKKLTEGISKKDLRLAIEVINQISTNAISNLEREQ